MDQVQKDRTVVDAIGLTLSRASSRVAYALSQLRTIAQNERELAVGTGLSTEGLNVGATLESVDTLLKHGQQLVSATESDDSLMADRIANKLLEIVEVKLTSISSDIDVVSRHLDESRDAYAEHNPADQIAGIAALLGELDHPELDKLAGRLREVAQNERDLREIANAGHVALAKILSATKSLASEGLEMIHTAGYGARQ